MGLSNSLALLGECLHPDYPDRAYEDEESIKASETIALGEDYESQHTAAQEEAPDLILTVAPERAQAQGSTRHTHDPEGGEHAILKVPAKGAHAMIYGK